jgi:hypothetical protein
MATNQNDQGKNRSSSGRREPSQVPQRESGRTPALENWRSPTSDSKTTIDPIAPRGETRPPPPKK